MINSLPTRTTFECVAGNDQAQGVVLLCDGNTFIAGADINEFKTRDFEPDLNAVNKALEDNYGLSVNFFCFA